MGTNMAAGNQQKHLSLSLAGALEPHSMNRREESQNL